MEFEMKYLLSILTFFLSFSVIVLSQDFANKGTWELGGSVGFTGTTPVFAGKVSTSNAISIFTFSPEASYFITDNFEVGLKPLSLMFINSNDQTTDGFFDGRVHAGVSGHVLEVIKESLVQLLHYHERIVTAGYAHLGGKQCDRWSFNGKGRGQQHLPVIAGVDQIIES